MRPPSASRPGQYVRAMVSLTSATGSESVVSAAVKARPRTSLSPSASSAPSEATCQSPFAPWPGVSTKPSTSSPQSPMGAPSGSRRRTPALFTPGSARTRSSEQPVEGHDLLRLRVSRLRQRETRGEHVVGTEARAPRAAAPTGSAGEGPRPRGGRRRAPSPRPPGRCAAGVGRVPPSSRARRRAGRPRDRRSASGARGRRRTPRVVPTRHRQREEEHAQVDPRFVRARDAGQAAAEEGLTPRAARTTPSRPLGSASTRLSATSCASSVARSAPRDERTAISRRRASARASSRWATFTQAIRRRKTTAPERSTSAGRTPPWISSRSGTANAEKRIASG